MVLGINCVCLEKQKQQNMSQVIVLWLVYYNRVSRSGKESRNHVLLGGTL